MLLGSGGDDGTVRLWDAETGTPIGEPLTGHDGRVSALTTLTLPNGQVLLGSGGDDGTVRLWDWEIGVEAFRLVTGAAVQDLTAFVDGVHIQLAIGGDAGIARLSVINSALRQGAHWSL
jgi:WD40 repeat protein